MNRLAALKNREEGRRCVLVANGPSLNKMDLSFLRHERTIGLNKIFLGFKQFVFYPRYYVAVNDLVVQQSAEEIRQLNCVRFVSSRHANWVPESALTYHLNTDHPPARFSQDISVGVHEGWTVTYVALQIAFYLGFHEVIIIGMDHRFQFSGKPNETSVMTGSDPNHFSPSYFAGQKWDNPDIERSNESYRLARQIYEAAGRTIIDATVDGACTVFEKKSYEEIFKFEK